MAVREISHGDGGVSVCLLRKSDGTVPGGGRKNGANLSLKL